MRLGTWMARACPSMQKLEVPLSEGISISLDLRKIDHQPIFLDGIVTAEEQERDLLTLLVPEGGTAIDHEQARDPRQIRDNVVGNAVAEIFLLRIAA